MNFQSFQENDSLRPMSLVVKPTEACNFSCEFCSSTNLVENKQERLELNKIYAFLKRFPRTTHLFIVGGDPLMMRPQYYLDLIEHIEKNNYPVIISMTSNLWDFYKNPEKWLKVLSHPKVELGTSFQYGEERKINPSLVFSEEIFRLVMKKIRKLIPHKEICFLAVINNKNEHLALKHVYLAKELNTQCRLVYANKSGLTTEPYPLSKLYKIFLEIKDKGLAQYEQTTFTIMDKLSGIPVACPLSRQCDYTMRSINPDGRYFTCGPLNDDLDPINEINFESEVIEGKHFHLPLQMTQHYQYLKEECLSCSMFQVCNGCRKHIKDLKNSGLVETHCTHMKEIIGDLKKLSNDPYLNLFKKTSDNERELYYEKNTSQ